MAYVSSDGNYGGDDALNFEASDLTPTQWGNLEEISDSERYDYVFAILNNDEEDIQGIEDAYDLPHSV